MKTSALRNYPLRECYLNAGFPFKGVDSILHLEDKKPDTYFTLRG